MAPLFASGFPVGSNQTIVSTDEVRFKRSKSTPLGDEGGSWTQRKDACQLSQVRYSGGSEPSSTILGTGSSPGFKLAILDAPAKVCSLNRFRPEACRFSIWTHLGRMQS